MSIDLEPRQPTTAPTGARLVADLVDVDLTASVTFAGGPPHDAFDQLRQAGGIAWHAEQPVGDTSNQSDLLQFVDSPGFWAITSHELLTEVSRTQSRFSSQLGSSLLPSLAPDSLVMFRQMLLNMDAPEHTRLRRILQPIFTPRAVQRLHEEIILNAAEIIADLDGQRTCDLVPAVSAEMPLRVLADLFGMPREDRHLIYEWSNAMLGAETAGGGPEAAAAAATAMGDLMAYGQQIADDRRANPQDDIITRIVTAEVDGERLTDTEFAMFWLLLVIAGNETTRNALSGAVIALQEQGLWTWLLEHPEALPTACDELLRFVSPVMQFRRTATQDTALGDQHVRAGDKVVVWFGAANRDPAVFADPHRLDLLREPNPHVAFGVGPHFCLGAHLARLEMAEMLGPLLRRAPGLSLTGAPSRLLSNFISGVTELPVDLGGPAGPPR